MSAPKCASCVAVFCGKEEFHKELLPAFCPMKAMGDVIDEAIPEYQQDDVQSIYVAATLTEKEAYEIVRGKRIPVRPRVRELIEFAKKIEVEKIGIAFCGGLSDEAHRLAEVLENFGFSVYSVRCKCGAVDKTRLGVPKTYKIGNPDEFEAACNSIAQAKLLNKAHTDLNVIAGLCVGHDILFTQYSKAPVTTIIVKDRYTGHNPVIALYNNYHKRSFLTDGRER